MLNLIVPDGYDSVLNVKETEKAIKALRIFFEETLSEELNLMRVSAPLFVRPESGLNDNLNEVERPVSFNILEQEDVICEIVQSLAKWKRYALWKYDFNPGEGIYTNMNAIRRDEITDNLHSIYVDQWDWERVILREERTESVLRACVESIYRVIKKTEEFIEGKFPEIGKGVLPERITFIKTQEMEDEFPNLSPKEREMEFAKRYGAVFIMQVGDNLNSGEPHDGRAADYDDWSLNGDILLYYPVLDTVFEISSMGIRVDKEALLRQLKLKNQEHKINMPYQKSLINEELPFTIGGGIGQSRLCMFLLKKAHIGEVQVSIWPDEVERVCREKGIHLL